MRLPVLATLTLTIWTAIAAAADAPSQVMSRHLQAVKAGNVDAVMADYASDAVLVAPRDMVTPSGVFAGRNEVRKFFVWLADPARLPGVRSLVGDNDMIAPDVVVLRWTQFKDTPQQFSGRDLFVIRKGKIVFQTINPDK